MYSGGQLHLDSLKIALDDASSEVCFVSHAHSDHTEAFSKKRKIIASEETFAIMGKPMQHHPVSNIALHPAGHMLGARQLSAETEEGRFVYTGDFALHDSFTTKAAPILECDTLMIDSTYCQPHLRMPPREQVLEKMRRFVLQNERSILIFGAYARGKGQELVAFLNRECGIAPVVNEKASAICEAYNKCGLKLDYLAAGTEEAQEAMRSPFVAITLPQLANFTFASKLSEAFGMEVKTAVATGWAATSRFPVDAAFALSDHADFKDTMQYIHGSGAKRIICANSGCSNAAAYLRSIGIGAEAKGEERGPKQTSLSSITI
jgi:putative mRNA 3-end processing factor